MNTLLQLFHNSDPEESIVHSQIARILVERCRLQHIYPWGLIAIKKRLQVEKKFTDLNIKDYANNFYM
jgi:hypothetical protein